MLSAAKHLSLFHATEPLNFWGNDIRLRRTPTAENRLGICRRITRRLQLQQSSLLYAV